MKKVLARSVAAQALIVLMTAAAQAQSSTDRWNNEIEVRGLVSVPSGEARFSLPASPGSAIDFSRDFDFSNELGFDLRYTSKSANRKHKLMVQYSQTTWERSRTLSRTFTFLGQIYTANLDTNSELKLRTLRGMYSYRWGNEKIRFGPAVDMGVVFTSLSITATTNNATGTRKALSISLLLPLVMISIMNPPQV
jgi:hypothetical protein